MLQNVIVTHTDLDGVAAAAIYIRLLGGGLGLDTSIVFTEPYKLHKVLKNVPRDVKRLAIMDLGPNASTFDEIVSVLDGLLRRSVVVEWYDHHRWREEWINKLSSIGTRIYVDTSTCAAGVVAKYAPNELGVEADDFVKSLVSATCAADLWKWDDPWAPKLYRVVGRYRGSKADAWRRLLVKGFSEGSLWWPELDDALSEYITRELKGFHKNLKRVHLTELDGCRIVFVLKEPGPPNTSILGNTLLHRYGADIAVIVGKRGKGLSLRSIRANVQRLAYRLGGGGHPRAAGAPLNLGFLQRIASFILPSIKLRHAKRIVISAIEELGGCHALLD